ncbi:MAG TPA: glycosyltransferase family 2 protein [Cyclobacteriaceae bacterium]|nr:glycosyltransferase family 2 protein [Cyclobacteriaceae bacterium]
MNVSVSMATHNGARFLREQLDSILPQLGGQDELVISDDQSTDDVLTIIRSYQDPRIRLLPARKFGSPLRNFEYILRHCNHEVIFLADQDDVWNSNKINVMRRHLETVDLVVCDCRLIDALGEPLASSFFSQNGSGPGLWKNLIHSSYMGCCMAFRRRILERALPIPAGVSLHDQWIGLIAERYFKVAFIPEILVSHRRHHNNYSTTGQKSRHNLMEKLEMRWWLTKQLFLS